eukprot:9854715-Alexandrium_andersonii.AAC.1
MSEYSPPRPETPNSPSAIHLRGDHTRVPKVRHLQSRPESQSDDPQGSAGRSGTSRPGHAFPGRNTP